MRARLVAQLNQVLETHDTARGLIVSMPDVLFDFNKYTLKPEAREKLAKISGIVLAYPDLKLDIEGHTDSIGSDEYNQKLSEERAAGVRGYLISSGVKPDNVAAVGLGKANPVADNSSAGGRKLNRRVEMVVSGDVIGTQIGRPGNTLQPSAQIASVRLGKRCGRQSRPHRNFANLPGTAAGTEHFRRTEEKITLNRCNDSYSAIPTRWRTSLVTFAPVTRRATLPEIGFARYAAVAAAPAGSASTFSLT